MASELALHTIRQPPLPEALGPPEPFTRLPAAFSYIVLVKTGFIVHLV
jgi:hypothetical protein